MELKTYPRYMYHRDHNEPVRVDSKAEQTDKENLGWTTARLYKEYPKWVGGKIVQSEVEERRVLATLHPEPPVPEEVDVPGIFETPVAVKETQVEGQDTAVFEKPKPGRPKKK